jgi:hypothetical protein
LDREVERRLRVAGLVECGEVVDHARLVPEGAPEAADRADHDLLTLPLAERHEADLEHLPEQWRLRIEDAPRPAEGS